MLSKILLALFGIFLLAGCGAVDDMVRVGAESTDEIGRITAAILAENGDDATRIGSQFAETYGEDAILLGEQLLSKYGDDAERVVVQTASQYGDDFAGRAQYFDDLLLPVIDNTDDYAQLVARESAEISLMDRLLDEFQLKNLGTDLFCLNLEKFLSDGELASAFDYSDLIQEKLGKVLLITEVMDIYEQSKDLQEFAEAVATGDSLTDILYRYRLNSMCLSLK